MSRVKEILQIIQKNAKRVKNSQITRQQQKDIQAQTKQDIRNVVAEYLIQNELCETQESAFAICEAMSEQWMREIVESEVSKPQERLVTDRLMFNIPKNEQEAARQRTLAKAKAMREKNKNK
jgi:hypothetical protein